MSTQKDRIVERILALWLSLALLFPDSAFALRPMTGQGAGLEELDSRLASERVSFSGLEEVPIESQWRVFPEVPVGDVSSVAFSRDGKKIFTGGQDPSIFQWDVMTGRLLKKAWRHPEGVRGLVFSPSGRHAATVDSDMIRVWNTETGEMVHATSLYRLRDRKNMVYVGGLDFTPQGELILPLTDTKNVQSKVIYRENPAVGDFPEWVWMNDPVHTVFLATSLLTERVVSVGKGSAISAWDLRSGALLGRWETGLKRVNLLAISPAGNRIAGTDSIQTVVVLNGQTGVVEKKYQVLSPMVQKLVFSPDGDRLAVLGSDGGIQLLNLSGSTAPDVVLAGHGGSVNDAAFSPDGALLASAGRDGTVRLWGPSSGTVESMLQDSAPTDWRRRRAAEWIGMQGGPQAVQSLFDLFLKADELFLSRLITLVLAAGANASGPVPFLSSQWARWLEAFGKTAARKKDFFGGEEGILFEQSFLKVLAFLGPDLDASVFENSLRNALAGVWFSDPSEGNVGQGYWMREQGPSNPKDRLAHVLSALKLKHYMQGYSRQAMELAEGLWRSGLSYQELAKISDLLDRYPGPVSTSLIQVADASGSDLSYIKAAARWWVEMDGIAPAFEILQIAGELAPIISEGGLGNGPELFSESIASLKELIANRAEDILGIQFDRSRPIPFLDERFSDPQRARFMRSLLYQAEQRGDVLREVLGVYFLELQKHPENPEIAVNAAGALLKQKSPNVSSDAFLHGPPTRDYSVPYSLRVSGDLSRVGEYYGKARTGLVQLSEETGMKEEAKSGLHAVLAEWNSQPPRSVAEAVDSQKRIQSATQLFLEALVREDRDRLLPVILDIRKKIHQVVSQLTAREALTRSQFVRIGVERDPTKIIHFAWPSDSCLDCQNGTHRKFTQHYVDPNNILITAEDSEQKDVPFLARVTLIRTEEGALLVTNAFSQQQQSLDLFPFFIDFLEEYGRLTGMPILYPQKFLMNRPADWKESRETVTLPSGIGNVFHADVAASGMNVIERLPLRLAHLPVWKHVPPDNPPARNLQQSGISIRDMNHMVDMMGRFLAAHSEPEVDAAFIRGVQGVLGFDGVALYHVRPAGNETGYEINSGVRTLDTPSRFETWAEPHGEHRKALMNGEGDLFILDRADKREAPFIDLERLERDRLAHSDGKVNSVYYVVLRNSEGQPWGLVLAHRWKSGKPIFGEGSADEQAYRREQIRGMTQVLGNGALLAYQQARAHQALKNHLKLSAIGGHLAGNLEKVLSRLRGLAVSTDLLAGDTRIGELSDLAGQMKRLVDELQPQAMNVRRISKERRVVAREPSGLAVMIEDAEALEGLLGDLSLSLLSAVAEDNSAEIERAQEEFLNGETKQNPAVRLVVEEWIRLARKTLETRGQMRRENEQFIPHLLKFMIGFQQLRQIRARMEQISGRNPLPDDLSSVLDLVVQEFDDLSRHLEAVIGQINGSLAQAGESPLVFETAGLEEKSDNGGRRVLLSDSLLETMPRFFYHPELQSRDFSGVEEIALPDDPETARLFLIEIGARSGDVVFLPDSVAADAEEGWRVDGISVVALPAVLFDELTPTHLAALALLTALRPDGLLRVGLEEMGETLGRMTYEDAQGRQKAAFFA